VSPAPTIIGLRREREVLTVALDTGRHVVIEGRPAPASPPCCAPSPARPGSRSSSSRATPSSPRPG